MTRDPADADDATQDTFLRYHTRNDDFESEAHLKAWLLRVAINRAKDLSGSFWRRNMTALEDYTHLLWVQAPAPTPGARQFGASQGQRAQGAPPQSCPCIRAPCRGPSSVSGGRGSEAGQGLEGGAPTPQK